MKRLFWTKPLTIAVTALLSAPSMAEKLVVNIDNISDIKGNMMVFVHNTKDSWMTDVEPFAKRNIPITDKTMSVEFDNLPEGNYSVMLYQDLNLNGKIDMNMIGMPKEPYGFSNNGGTFGPPSYKAAHIDHADLGNVIIHLKK